MSRCFAVVGMSLVALAACTPHDGEYRDDAGADARSPFPTGPLAPLPSPGVLVAATATAAGDLYVLGGSNAVGFLSSVRVYRATENRWDDLPALDPPRDALGAATGDDGRIYVLGGRSNVGGALDRVEAFSPVTQQWETLPPMSTPRVGLTAVAGADAIYAIGGSDAKGEALATVEVYSPTSKQWRTIAPMYRARMAASAVRVGPSDGRIYVLGGRDEMGVAHDSGEVFDPATNQWTGIEPMHDARYWFGAAATSDGRLHVMGGLPTSAVGAVVTVESFDPATATWTTRGEMPEPRAWGRLVGQDDTLYFLGGAASQDAQPVSTIWAWDANGDRWAN